jgi:hypothetical protein
MSFRHFGGFKDILVILEISVVFLSFLDFQGVLVILEFFRVF